ncbi:hypothetical protein [Streptomyces mexicanus]|uniref:hypothetical protein n=1 Tax=Streptomyces mexicanus TaxID=178566 RepID=UPI003663538D
MSIRTLPHDPYIQAVVDALTAAGLEPTEWETDDTETDRYASGPDAGLTTMLTALLVWDGDHPAIGIGEYDHGVALVWEHPAEQWQWAPRGEHGELEREPEFLPALPLWAHPAGAVEVVRELLAGRPLPEGERIRWHERAAVQDAVDAWATEDSSE